MPLLDRLLAWWYGRQLRAHHRQRAAAPAEALRFPFQMGLPMPEVRAAIEREYGDDTALDSPYPTTNDRRDRLRQYILNNPGGASVNVAYKYQEGDQRVWAIRVSHAAPGFAGNIGEVALTADVASVIACLGPPTSETQRAPVIRVYVWELPESIYRIDAYSEIYDDIGGYHRAGAIHTLEWSSRALGPAVVVD
jgi:hypothetical protein